MVALGYTTEGKLTKFGLVPLSTDDYQSPFGHVIVT